MTTQHKRFPVALPKNVAAMYLNAGAYMTRERRREMNHGVENEVRDYRKYQERQEDARYKADQDALAKKQLQEYLTQPSKKGDIKSFEGFQILKMIEKGLPETLALFDSFEQEMLKKEFALNRNYDAEIERHQVVDADPFWRFVPHDLATLILRKKDAGIVKVLRNPASVEEIAEKAAVQAEFEQAQVNSALLMKELRAAIAGADTPKAAISLEGIAGDTEFYIWVRPEKLYSGRTHKIRLDSEVASAKTTANMMVTIEHEIYPNDVVWSTKCKISALRKTLAPLLAKVSDYTLSPDAMCDELAKRLKAGLNSTLDLVITSSHRRDTDDWFTDGEAAVKIYGPGKSSAATDALGQFAVVGAADPKGVNQLIPGSFWSHISDWTIENNPFGTRQKITEDEILPTAKKFIQYLEKRWDDPEVRAKFDLKYAEALEKIRIQKEKTEAAAEAARRAEEAAVQKKLEREQAKVKKVVNSEHAEKISILSDLANKSPKPEVKALAALIQGLYESGDKPDDEQLKRIRNYLYMTGMRPQADHFRVASEKSVALRWASDESTRMRKMADIRKALSQMFGAHLPFVKDGPRFINDLTKIFMEFWDLQIVQKDAEGYHVTAMGSEGYVGDQIGGHGYKGRSSFDPPEYEEADVDVASAVGFSITGRLMFKNFPRFLYDEVAPLVRDRNGFMRATVDMLGNRSSRAMLAKLWAKSAESSQLIEESSVRECIDEGRIEDEAKDAVSGSWSASYDINLDEGFKVLSAKNMTDNTAIVFVLDCEVSVRVNEIQPPENDDFDDLGFDDRYDGPY